MHLHNICEATTTDDDDEEEDYYDTDIKEKAEESTLREMGMCRCFFLFGNGWCNMRDMSNAHLVINNKKYIYIITFSKVIDIKNIYILIIFP